MIAKHLCVHDKYRKYYPSDEHCVTSYYKDYPPFDVVQDGLDATHYVVLELIPDELVDTVIVKSKLR